MSTRFQTSPFFVPSVFFFGVFLGFLVKLLLGGPEYCPSSLRDNGAVASKMESPSSSADYASVASLQLQILQKVQAIETAQVSLDKQITAHSSTLPSIASPNPACPSPPVLNSNDATPGTCLDPATMGETTHAGWALPWPKEFRTWLTDTPSALTDLMLTRGVAAGTDKMSSKGGSDHSYQYMYGKYLFPARYRPEKLLEIGLGCDMGYGPGKSMELWMEVLPKVTYYSIEFDAACAEKFRSTLGDRLFIGDQSDVAFLQRVKAGIPTPVDIIIDDGSHISPHARISFRELWSKLAPGGIYVIEDLQTNFWDDPPQYQGEHTGSKVGTTTAMIRDMIYANMGRLRQSDSDDTAYNPDYMSSLASIDCFREACVLIKK
jgi:hypothetical protein